METLILHDRFVTIIVLFRQAGIEGIGLRGCTSSKGKFHGDLNGQNRGLITKYNNEKVGLWEIHKQKTSLVGSS